MYSQLPSIPGGRSSIRNPRTRHAVVTGTHLTWTEKMLTVGNYARKNFYTEHFSKLRGRFPGVSGPSESTAQQLMKKFRKYSLFEKK
jgi:hypothetical protein